MSHSGDFDFFITIFALLCLILSLLGPRRALGGFDALGFKFTKLALSILKF